MGDGASPSGWTIKKTGQVVLGIRLSFVHFFFFYLPFLYNFKKDYSESSDSKLKMSCIFTSLSLYFLKTEHLLDNNTVMIKVRKFNTETGILYYYLIHDPYSEFFSCPNHGLYLFFSPRPRSIWESLVAISCQSSLASFTQSLS